MEQKRIKKVSKKSSNDDTQEVGEELVAKETVDNEILEYTDELLAEIDSALESMGVEVVLEYVQKGGQ
jgi:ubiquitin-like protein Pup